MTGAGCMLKRSRMAQKRRPTAAETRTGKSRSSNGASEKDARRQDAKERKATAGPDPADEDPDIAHIKLGPQPLADWQIEEVRAKRSRLPLELRTVETTGSGVRSQPSTPQSIS